MDTLLLTCRYQSVDPCSFIVAHELCSQADFNSTLSINHTNADIWLGSYMTPTVHLQITSSTSVGTSTILHKWPSSHMSCTLQQHLRPANGPFLTQQSRVTLQLAVSQPVFLGFKPSSAHNQCMFWMMIMVILSWCVHTRPRWDGGYGHF